MSAILELSRVAGVIKYGETNGVCRFTGQLSTGIPFRKWVKDTFTDHGCLLDGDIVSNEAAFCFDEASVAIQIKTGRDKPQKFRTYSHIIDKDGVWHCLTKADKPLMLRLICDGAEVVCLTDSGQKHLFFKHKDGFWQLDETHIYPDSNDLAILHASMMSLLAVGFTQEEVKTGRYDNSRILKAGIDTWKNLDGKINRRRGEPIFDLAAWLMWSQKAGGGAPQSGPL